MYTSHQRPSYSYPHHTMMQMPSAHKHTYPHHTRCPHEAHNHSFPHHTTTATPITPDTLLQLPTLHQISTACIHSYPRCNQRTTTATYIGLNLLAPGLTTYLDGRVLVEVYLQIVPDAKKLEPQMKFTHHRPCNLHFTIAS